MKRNNMFQSLPVNPGAINIPPTPRVMYHIDPNYLIKKKSDIRFFYHKGGKFNSKTEDSFNIARQPELKPVKATTYDDRGIFKNIKRNEWFEPLQVVRPPKIPEPALTGTQVGLMSAITDPTQKYFLLEAFKKRISITEDIKGRLTGISPVDMDYLSQALNRLNQKYISLNNTNTLTQSNVDTIINEFFNEIKPIYAKWKNANPSAVFDPVGELESGLGLQLQQFIPAVSAGQAPIGPSLIRQIFPTPAPVAPIGAPTPVPSPITPVGGPTPTPVPAPTPTPAPTPSPVVYDLQTAQNSYDGVMAELNKPNIDVKVLESFFDTLNNSLNNLSQQDLKSFEISKNAFKDRMFIQNYALYLQNSNNKITQDVADMVPTQPGQTNPLGQYVLGSVPTPTPPQPVQSITIDAVVTSLSPNQNKTVVAKVTGSTPKGKINKNQFLNDIKTNKQLEDAFNQIIAIASKDTSNKQLKSKIVDAYKTYISQPQPSPPSGPSPSPSGQLTNQQYLNEITKLFTKGDLIDLFRKVYSGVMTPDTDGWPQGITVDDMNTQKQYTKDRLLGEIFDDMTSTGYEVERKLKDYYNYYNVGKQSGLSQTKAKAAARSQVGFGNGLLNKKSQYKTGGNTKSKMNRLKQLLKTL